MPLVRCRLARDPFGEVDSRRRDVAERGVKEGVLVGLTEIYPVDSSVEFLEQCGSGDVFGHHP